MNLVKPLGDKQIIWFQEANRYLLVEPHAFKIIEMLSSDGKPDEIALWCSKNYGLPFAEGARFVGEIKQVLDHLGIAEEKNILDFSIEAAGLPAPVFSERYYGVNGLAYRVEYGTERMEALMHPRFAHLEAAPATVSDHHFQLLEHDGSLVLAVDGKIAGMWHPDDVVLLAGRFFIELLNRMYHRSENDWMAVFHASAISDGNRCILFPGDSGSGKSTLSAILMAHGFQLCSDDFVPVDSRLNHVFSFPSALSVKNNAMDLLAPIFPQLDQANEFYFPGIDKSVRYLAPASPPDHQHSSFPCTALVFVNYQPDSGLILEPMPKDIAFQHLVPDSWISPLPENAERFLDWFLEMPCYQLTYSDNEAMVEAVRQLAVGSKDSGQ